MDSRRLKVLQGSGDPILAGLSGKTPPPQNAPVYRDFSQGHSDGFILSLTCPIAHWTANRVRHPEVI